MSEFTPEQVKFIRQRLEEGKSLPEEYRWLIFEGKQETELIYAWKTRDVDVLTETMAVPLQKVKVFGDVKDDEWHNMLIFGDNLQILKTLLKMKQEGKLKNADGTKGVRLIYIDPPFGTGEIYGRNNVGAYSAKLMGAKYLEWLRQRIILLKELLSDDGNFYMRIDYHFGHYMKVLLDEIFGKENFRNEIVVNRIVKKGFGANRFPTATDSVFFYTNSENYLFNGFRKKLDKPKEAWWHDMSSMTAGHVSGSPKIIFGKLLYPPSGRAWTFSQERINQMIKEKKIRIRCGNCGYIHTKGKWNGCPKCGEDNPRVDYLVGATDTEPIDSNWTDIPGYTFKWSYPTENSEPLLERIIKASSNEGDIALDAFAGSGTTGAVAEKLNRRWIMIDSSKFAIYTMMKRMLNLKEKIGNKGKPLKPKPFAVYNAGLYDMKILKELPFKEYRRFALELFQCKDEPHKIAGIDLDGYFGQGNVLVFKWKIKNGKEEYVMDRGFIDNLHSILGNRIGKRFFIIAPAASVMFLEDYIEKDGIRYYVLRIPYSVIDELHKKNFKVLKQPTADMNVNDIMEQVGFDFIYPPDVECEYYIEQPEGKIFKEAVIKIKNFRSNIVSKNPISKEEVGLKALSMVMIDYDYNGEYFDMDDKWFAEDLKKNNYEIRFPVEKLTDRMMIIYMDVFGNERKEIKGKKDFKKWI